MRSNPVELSVAILLDHVHALVARDECGDFGRKWQRPHAQIIGFDAGIAQHIARLDDRVMRCAVGQDRRRLPLLVDDRLGYDRARRLVLAHRTIEIALPDVGHLGVSRFFVVARAARKVTGTVVIRSR